jgi:hypothetical protein
LLERFSKTLLDCKVGDAHNVIKLRLEIQVAGGCRRNRRWRRFPPWFRLDRVPLKSAANGKPFASWSCGPTTPRGIGRRPSRIRVTEKLVIAPSKIGKMVPSAAPVKKRQRPPNDFSHAGENVGEP